MNSYGKFTVGDYFIYKTPIWYIVGRIIKIEGIYNNNDIIRFYYRLISGNSDFKYFVYKSIMYCDSLVCDRNGVILELL